MKPKTILLGLAILLGTLAGLVAFGVVPVPGRGRGGGGGGDETIDAAARALHQQVLARRSRDGADGYMVTFPSDSGSTAEALAGIAAFGDAGDKDLAASLARWILERDRAVHRPAPDGGAARFAGWPFSTGDTLASGEPTGYCVAAIAIARGRYDLPLEADTRRLARHLVAMQNPDGSFGTLFGVPDTARASSVQNCLFGLLAADAVEKPPTPEVVEAVKKCTAYIGEGYDDKAKGWFPRRRRAWGQRKIIPGLSESYVWLLLESRDYLAAAGQKLPAPAEAALRDFAGALAPSDALAPETLEAAEEEDYAFEIAPGETTGWHHGARWCWLAWRALAVERLVHMPDNPRVPDWAAERERLRPKIAALPKALETGFTFHVAESLLMTGTLRARAPDDPERGSVLALIRKR